MARIYAGALGLIAFLTCLARGILHGQPVEGTLQAACVALGVFAAVGGAMGGCAAWMIAEESQIQMRESPTPRGKDAREDVAQAVR